MCCDQGSLPGGGELMLGSQRKRTKSVRLRRTAQAKLKMCTCLRELKEQTSLV